MAKHAVDWAGLANALNIVCLYRNVSLRTAAEEMGISNSGLTRIRQGKALDADGLASLLVWLSPQGSFPWIKES